MKKFICAVCGYVYEGEEAPEFCPQCKVPRSKFKELVETEGALTFADEHVIGSSRTCPSTLRWPVCGPCPTSCSS